MGEEMACDCDSSSTSPKRGKEGCLNNEGRLDSGNKPRGLLGEEELVDVEGEWEEGVR